MKTLSLRFTTFAFLASIGLFSSGCSTLGLGGSSGGDVVIRSTPDRAQVFAIDFKTGNETLVGQTPLTFQKEKYSQEGSEVIQLRIEQEGYQSKAPSIATYSQGTVYLDVKLSPVSIAKKEIRDSFEKMRTHRISMNQLIMANRYADALGDAEAMIALDPQNAETFASKGSILFLMKDFTGAEQAWSKALELNPSYDSVRDSLIRLKLDKGNRLPSSKEGT